MNLTQIKIALGAIKRLFYDSRPQKLGGHGKNIYIEYPLMFHNPSNIFLEDNTSIKAFTTTVLNTTGKFIMKRNSTAAQNLTVVTGNHHYVKGRFFNDSIKYRLADIEKDVIVEEDALICANVTLLSGVVIGRGCIIGAGTIVRKSTPPYSIVIGNPARVIKFVLSPEDIVEHELNLYPETERLSLDILKKYQETYIGKTL